MAGHSGLKVQPQNVQRSFPSSELWYNFIHLNFVKFLFDVKDAKT